MYLVGAGGHAKVVADILLANQCSIKGVWDDNPDADIFGIAVSGTVASLASLEDDLDIIIAIGNNYVRQKVFERLIHRRFGVAIHPSSVVSNFSKVSQGTVVMANTTINAGSFVGNHVIVNTNSSIDHDCVLSDFVHISPKVAIAGGVTIGFGTHVGIGASVVQGLNIGKHVTIGAGTVVLKDVPDYAVLVGNPGRIIRYNKSLFKNG